MPVTVAKPVARTVQETAEFTGRFQASGAVQVTSRVTGTIISAPFKEGSMIKAGDVLFAIDARPFQAAADQARAQVQVSQTRLDLARTNLSRSQELRTSGNVTDVTLQTNQQAFLEAQATIQASRAALTSAELDLEYAQIKAPIAGRVGRKLVTEGNLVVANSTSALTSIVSFDPVYFYFDVDEASYLEYQRANTGAPAETRTALVALSDEPSFKRKATLDYIDPQIDAQTGSISVRATLSNADGFLTPGLFGRIRVPISPPYQGMVLPAEAVGTSAQGTYVMVAGADGTVAAKPVQAGSTFGGFRVVRQGLGPEDQVIVNGLMRARPGAKVVPQMSEPKEVPEDLASLLPGPAGQAPAGQVPAPPAKP